MSLSRIFFPHPNRMSGAALGLLALLGFLVLAPGLFLMPPTDRDESRFAQASRQMLESGDWTDIRFQDAPRYKKPVGIYWLQAGAVTAAESLGFDGARAAIGLYRLPSLLGALAALLLTAMTGARLTGARGGFTAACLLGSCLLMNAEARLAKTDAVLLALSLATVLVLAKAYMRAGLPRPLRAKDFLLFWGALGLGFLVKGPVIFIVALGLPLALRLMKEDFRWLSPLRPVLGAPLFLLIAAPWFIAISLQSQGAFLQESAGHDLLAKIWQGQNWGGAPPGYHALVSWGVFWPASLPLWLALPWLWRERASPHLKFLIAWTLPVYLVFEIVFSKLPHYTLPAAPALMMAAAAWLAAPAQASRAPRLWRGTCLAVFSLLAIALCAAPAVLPVFVEGTIHFFPIFFGGLALGFALAAVQLLMRDQRKLVAWPLCLAGAMLALALFRFVLPGMPHAFLGARIAENLRPLPSCAETRLAIAGYNEPSLVFLAGTGTQLMGKGEDVALALSADPCLTGGVEEAEMESFNETLERLGLRAGDIITIKGFNMGRGKPATVTLFHISR